MTDQQEAEVRIAATNLNQHVEDGFLWLTCGLMMGKLHKDRFYCPGIHMECIEVEDGVMITPKMFVKLGDKEKLKDWKTAVRVNGVPIRRYIEAGHLDFYRHKETCTMRCLSRSQNLQRPELQLSSVSSINELTFNAMDSDGSKLQGSPIVTKASSSTNATPLRGLRPVPISLVTAANVSNSDKSNLTQTYVITSANNAHNLGSNSCNSATLVNAANVKSGLESQENGSDGGNDSYQPDVYIKQEFEEPEDAEDEDTELDAQELSYFEHCQDTQTFWRGILQVGLLDQILLDIVQVVNKLKRELVMSSVGKEEAKKLTRLVEHLGMMNQIRGKVAQQRVEMQKQKDLLKKEMDELKRKVAEAELRQYELKRKSECFDQLIEMSLKRPNVSRLSPAPSDKSELSTLGDDVVESEHSECTSEGRGSFSKRGRRQKPTTFVRIVNKNTIDDTIEDIMHENEADETVEVGGNDDDNDMDEVCVDDEVERTRIKEKPDGKTRHRKRKDKDEDYIVDEDEEDDDDD